LLANGGEVAPGSVATFGYSCDEKVKFGEPPNANVGKSPLYGVNVPPPATCGLP
jgi:hypothetical protein